MPTHCSHAERPYAVTLSVAVANDVIVEERRMLCTACTSGLVESFALVTKALRARRDMAAQAEHAEDARKAMPTAGYAARWTE